MLTKPGLLSREFADGRRVRYVSPIRLYLLFSVLYFGVAAFAPADTFRVNITFTPGPNDTPQEIAEAKSRLPKIQKAAIENMMRWLPRAMFVLVPLFAGIVALVNPRSGKTYPLHLYFVLHVQAAWFLAGAVAAAARISTIPLVATAASGLAFIYGAVYIVLALRTMYSISLPGAVVRAAIVTSVYFVLGLASFLAIVAPVVFGR